MAIVRGIPSPRPIPRPSLRSDLSFVGDADVDAAGAELVEEFVAPLREKLTLRASHVSQFLSSGFNIRICIGRFVDMPASA